MSLICMLVSTLVMLFRTRLPRDRAVVVAVGLVALAVGAGMAVQAGFLGVELGGEIGVEMGDVSSTGEGSVKTGPDSED